MERLLGFLRGGLVYGSNETMIHSAQYVGPSPTGRARWQSSGLGVI